MTCHQWITLILEEVKKANHIIFDEATAILAGDALQSWAFELISNPNNISNAEIRSEMILNLSKGIGMLGMAAGQQADIDLQNLKIGQMIFHGFKKKNWFLIKMLCYFW